MIPQEKAEEFQQVAALVCQDLDTLAEIAEDKSLSADDLRSQIKHIQKMKEELIADPNVRKMRFQASLLLWSAVASGQVRSTPLE